MRTVRALSSAAVLLAASSCGSAPERLSSSTPTGIDGASTSTAVTGATTSDPAVVPTSAPGVVTSGPGTPDAEPAQRYVTTAYVIETPEHGPEITPGLLTSYPPQGGGIPLPDWTWDGAPDARSASGTSWGGPYRLVGTWDGTAFALTEPATPATDTSSGRPLGEPTPGCDEDDVFAVLDVLGTLDREALGIVGGSEDVHGGRCGATVVANFDTPELRAALEPVADRVTTSFRFTPLEGG